MTRHLPLYLAALLLGIGFSMISTGCGNSNTAPSAAPTADQAQAQQANEQAAAAAKAQGEAAKAAAQHQASQHQAGPTH